jgi:hypothetical protein
MLDKIKEVVFVYENSLDDIDSSTDLMEYDDSDDSHQLDSNSLIVMRKGSDDVFIGSFVSCHYSQDQTFQAITIGDFLKEKKNKLFDEPDVIFRGQNGIEGDEQEIDINDIVFLMPVDENISLSNAMNNDTSQPQRAIGNYLQRELENSVFKNDPIEFYQNILDVANRELEMHKEGAYIV